MAGKNFIINGILQIKNAVVNSAAIKQISQAVAGINAKNVVPQFNQATNSVNQLGKSLNNAKNSMNLLDHSADLFLKRMAQFAILLPTFVTLNRSIQGGVKFMVDFQTELTKVIRTNPGELASKIDEISEAVFNVSTRFGVAADVVLSTIRVFQQAGFEIEQSFELASAASLATQVTTLDLASAQEILIQSFKIFGSEALSAIEVIDKLANVEDKAAVDAIDLAEAFRTGGNALQFSTKSIDDTIGLITGLREQTRKSGREIGTFFKTLATRLLAAGDAKTAVESFGVSVQDTQGNLRPMLDVLNDLKGKFDQLTEAEQATAAKAIAGVRQFESLLATLNSLETANRISAASAGANGAALEKLDLASKNVSFQLGQFISKAQQFAKTLGDTGLLSFFTTALRLSGQLFDSLSEILKLISGLGGSITPLLAVGAFSLAKKTFSKPGGNVSDAVVPASKPTGKPKLAGTFTSLAGLAALPGSNAPKTNQTPSSFVSSKFLPASSTSKANNKSLAGVLTFSDKLVRAATAAAALGLAHTKLSEVADSTGGKLSQSLGVLNDSIFAGANAFTQVSTFLGPKFGGLAAIIATATSSVSTFVKALNENTSANAELNKSGRLDAQFSKLKGQVADPTSDVFKKLSDIFAQFSKDGKLQSPKEFFARVNLDLSKSSIGDEIREFLDSDNIAQIIGPEFLLAFGQALNVPNIVEAIGDSPSKALREIFRTLTGDTVDISPEQIKEAALRLSLTSEQSIKLSQALAAVEPKFIEINNSISKLSSLNTSDILNPDELKRAITDRNLAAAEEAAALSNLNSVVKLASKEVKGFADQNELLNFMQRLTSLSKEADLSQIGIFETLRTEFSEAFADGETAVEDLIEAQLKLRESTLKVAESDAKIIEIEQKTAFERTKIAKEFARDFNEQISEFEKSFRELGISIGSDVFEKIKKTNFEDVASGLAEMPQEIRDIVSSLSGSELQSTQQEFLNTIDGFKIRLSDLRAELAQVDGSLLALESSGMRVDTALGLTKEELIDLSNKLKIDIKATELQSVKSTLDGLIAVEKLRADALSKVNKESRQSVAALNEVSVQFAQFAQSKRASLLEEEAGAQEALKSAQAGTIDATKGLSEAYKEFRATIISVQDSIINNTIEFNILARDIGILTGKINTFNGRLSSLNQAYLKAIDGANISLQKRIELERQLANETLSFLNEARSSIVNSGLDVFGQSAEENRALQEGIGGLEFVAQKLGGSFESFLQKSKSGFNSLSNELLNLPVDFRKKILDALSALPSTADIGGFSVDQLREAIGQIGAGVDPSVGLPSLGEITDLQVQQLERLQELAISDSEVQANQLFIAQDQLIAAQEQLDIAKLQEERAREDLLAVRESVDFQSSLLDSAIRLQDKLTKDIINASTTNKLDQIREQANEFQRTRDKFGDVGNEIVQAISRLVEARRGVIEATANLPSRFSGFIPNLANGNLTPREAAGLIRAGSREKRAMPAGASLAVANTSEAIIPLNKGFIPNFAEGNTISAGIAAGRGINDSVVAAITASLVKSLQSVPGNNDQVAAILRVLNDIKTETTSVSNGLIAVQTILAESSSTQSSGSTTDNQISISLTTDQNNTVTVTGLESLVGEVRSALDADINQLRTEIDQKLETSIRSLFQSLRERGLITSLGQGI